MLLLYYFISFNSQSDEMGVIPPPTTDKETKAQRAEPPCPSY